MPWKHPKLSAIRHGNYEKGNDGKRKLRLETRNASGESYGKAITFDAPICALKKTKSTNPKDGNWVYYKSPMKKKKK